MPAAGWLPVLPPSQTYPRKIPSGTEIVCFFKFPRTFSFTFSYLSNFNSFRKRLQILISYDTFLLCVQYRNCLKYLFLVYITVCTHLIQFCCLFIFFDFSLYFLILHRFFITTHAHFTQISYNHNSKKKTIVIRSNTEMRDRYV